MQKNSTKKITQTDFFSYIRYAFFIFLFVSAIYMAFNLFIDDNLYAALDGDNINKALLFVFLSTFYFLIARSITFFISLLKKKAVENNNQVKIKLFSFINISINIIYFMLVVNLALRLFSFYDHQTEIAKKIGSVALVVIIAWIIVKIFNILQQAAVTKISSEKEETVDSQKMLTHLTIMRRIAMIVIVVIAIIVVLMMFDSMRQLGETLLASAGVIAAIITFTAQKTLANVFAGMQIALYQPIRMHDAVIVEGEFGTIEDINLTNVVIKLWDLRRLIVPISYFIERPFENWSRESDYIFGTVFLYLDYNAPIKKLRSAYEKELETSEFWDHKLQNLQVSEVSEHTIQIRLLMSAQNASELWNLRCEMREKMIHYIQKHFPECLPKYHIITDESKINHKMK